MFILLCYDAMSQNEGDALRYGRYYYTGTARYAAMGGAFGALGADISNLANNPAGLGMFRKHQITLTPGVSINSSKSVFSGETHSDSRATFNLANLGFVYSSKLGKGRRTPYTGWQFLNVGLAYTKTSDLNRQSLSRGNNSENSLLDVFQNNANQGFADPYYESLAIQSQLLVTDSTTGQYYAFDAPWPKVGKIQRQEIEGKGSMGDVSFALGANYANKLYIGASFNISVIDYRQTNYYSEEDAADTIPTFANFTVKEYFRTRGSGISGKFGIIYRPADFIRFGVSIHTPTVYTLTDNYTTDVTANFDAGGKGEGLSPLGVFKYRYNNPFRFQFSTGFVLGKYALIGLEYEFVNYKGPKFRDITGTVNSFQDVNDRIKYNYRNGHILKAGAELNLQPFSLRAGLNYGTNPYQSQINNSATWGASAGAGYRSVSTGFFIDAAYTLFVTQENSWMYDPTIAPSVYTQLQKHNILLTAGFNF